MVDFYLKRVKGLLYVGITILFLASCAPRHQISGASRKLYSVNPSLALDSQIIKSYLPYKQQLDEKMNEIIGENLAPLSKDSELPESPLGNFFADACLQEVLKLGNKVDFAMPTTKGGMRSNLPKGQLSLRNIYELMPFENELIIVELSGRQVRELLDFIVISDGQPVAGLKIQIRNNKAENVLIGQRRFDEQQNYFVLTSDYILSGGDGARGFTAPISQNNTKLKVRDALIAYIKSKKSNGVAVSAALDQRITHHE